MDPKGPLWGLRKGAFSYTWPCIVKLKGIKYQVAEWWLEPRHKSEDQAEHRSHAVEAKVGVQEGRKRRL